MTDGQPTADGAVWRTEDGDGDDTVVLVHGTMDRSASFGRVARQLSDLRVVRYDRRGYARSRELGPPTSFDQQVDDLLGVIGEQPAVVSGHSYGGTIALAAAVRAPELIPAVHVHECPMPWRSWWPTSSAGARAVAGADDPAGAAEAFMRRMVGDRRWERLPPSTREARLAEGPTLVAELAQLREPPAPFSPADITVPVVTSCGDQSAPHHIRSVEEIAATVPHSEHVQVDDASHGLHLTHPGVYADLVRWALDAARSRRS